MAEPARAPLRPIGMGRPHGGVAGTLLGVAGLLGVLVLGGCGTTGDDGGEPAPAPSAASSPSGGQVDAKVVGEVVGEAVVAGERVLISRQRHPRGGFQIHLYAGGAELRDADGNPVVPFVATDTRPVLPVSADCTEDGFAVTEARPTVPRGVVFGWDVFRTTYRLDGSTAVRTGRDRLEHSVPDRTLRRDLPALFEHRMFPSCRAPAGGS